MKKITRYFIKTDNPTYEIGNNQVHCRICTSLKSHLNDGNSKILHSYMAEGKAKCSADDKFDITKGIKIATARAEIDYHKHYRKWLDSHHTVLMRMLNAAVILDKDCESQIEHNIKYVEDLIK